MSLSLQYTVMSSHDFFIFLLYLISKWKHVSSVYLKNCMVYFEIFSCGHMMFLNMAKLLAVDAKCTSIAITQRLFLFFL